jgi:hypothetical protein
MYSGVHKVEGYTKVCRITVYLPDAEKGENLNKNLWGNERSEDERLEAKN